MAESGSTNPDMALVHRVLDSLSREPSEHIEGQRLFKLLYHFNSFVLWNGIDDYFDQGYDHRVPEVIAGLRAVGAHPYADLMERAVEARDRPEELEQIKDEYYTTPDDLYEFMARYARGRPNDFRGARLTDA